MKFEHNIGECISPTSRKFQTSSPPNDGFIQFLRNYSVARQRTNMKMFGYSTIGQYATIINTMFLENMASFRVVATLRLCPSAGLAENSTRFGCVSTIADCDVICRWIAKSEPWVWG